ncbi:N-acetylmuramoyl-L-alanine amidase [Streptomyces canus]|uniref:peptidoglycan recognition protein family protein n=1 Tax=Streptomyces canus TaxID=58343 RepID=UPI0033ECC461
MAWYPGAVKMELQPESDSQPAIKPTQFILHSIVAPWTPQRTYEYWRDSTNLESHFGLGYDGTLGQYIGTETRADATGAANRRADGTGAVSLESASNLQASDPWTAAQVETLIKLGVWLHEKHGIPLRICRNASDPGFGYHRLFTAWNPDGHSCPGDARVKQFKEVVFPGIVARATGTTPPPEETHMPLTNADGDLVLDRFLAADKFDAPADATDYSDDPSKPGHYWSGRTVFRDLVTRVRNLTKSTDSLHSKIDALPVLAMTDAQIAALASAVAANPALAEQIAEKVAVKLAERLAD